MDMSSMSGMGMDMGMEGPFKSENARIARAYWYIIASIVGIRGLRTAIDHLRARSARRRANSRSWVPSRRAKVITQPWDTIHAICRELSYPAMRPFSGRLSKYFIFPSLGKCLILLTYWTIILIMLWTNVLLPKSSDIYAYHWEKVGFRAAWVSVTQVPLIYALSCKFNIISILTGISYERLNWFHRWTARTLFLTVIVHWSSFFREWDLASFVKWELKLMPMVKYGFGAWAVIGWTVILGFGFFRAKIYELWILQHLAAAGILLWLLHIHVPSHAQYNIWMAVSFVASDRGVRGLLSMRKNLHIKGRSRISKIIGFRTRIEPLPHDYMRVTIKNADFAWRPGQHIYLSVPAVFRFPFESHPFTISSCASNASGSTRDLALYLKIHGGFTRRLFRQACKASNSGQIYAPRAFISGPWGIPPLTSIERANSLILLSTSTGASFTIPLFEYAITKSPLIQRISFHWIIPFEAQIGWFRTRLKAALASAQTLGIESVECKIYITRKAKLIHGGDQSACCESASSTNIDQVPIKQIDREIEKQQSTTTSKSVPSSSIEQNCPDFTISYIQGRPKALDPLIRPTVEAARGETVVIACGSTGLVADVGNYTACLSDERVVRKGSGAQGLFFFGEEYRW